MEAFPRLNQARGIFNIDRVPGSTSNLTQDPWWLKIERGQWPIGIHCLSKIPSERIKTLKNLYNNFTDLKKNLSQGK